MLYKVQAAAEVPLDAELEDDDPCLRFLADFLAAVQPNLQHAE